MGILSVWTDPAMDWLFMGHHNGEITAFDVDRVVWNLAKNEILYDLHYEFPFTNAVWHPSGSHIASSHVNGFV
ncbi:hypothetical protein FF38_13390, partial [Lucilia cuprina]